MINRNEETGNVTYPTPDGATYTVPFKNAEYVVACNGYETPHRWAGKHYILMWYKNEKKHDWLCLEEDMRYDTPPWEKEYPEAFKV